MPDEPAKVLSYATPERRAEWPEQLAMVSFACVYLDLLFGGLGIVVERVFSAWGRPYLFAGLIVLFVASVFTGIVTGGLSMVRAAEHRGGMGIVWHLMILLLVGGPLFLAVLIPWLASS